MIILLPPSETKTDGGVDASALDLAALSFPELTPQRRATLAAVRQISTSLSRSREALGLGSRQDFETLRNRAVRSSPVLPAIDRYAGVLYEAIAVPALLLNERQFALDHVVIQSALFGLLAAADPVPAYRLSHDSRLPGRSLRSLWRAPIATGLQRSPGLTLDLRSHSYVALGPAPASAVTVRVVSDSPDGRRLAVSHANKAAKGALVGAIVRAGIDHATVGDLLDWATATGLPLEPGMQGGVDLLVTV